MELTRFLQLRSVQKLTREQILQSGLSAYPEGLSALIKQLQEAGCDKELYLEIIVKFLRGHRLTLGSIHPLVKTLYEWVDFKSRPIRAADFKKFVGGELTTVYKRLVDEDQLSPSTEELTRYADHLVAHAIPEFSREISDVEFEQFDHQLLIKIW